MSATDIASVTTVVGPQPARLPHAPALDGVRGLAVAAVVVFHCGASTWLPGGFLGVSLFFTLSGYLITSLILAEVEQTGSLALGAFWARRVRRLVPAMLLTLFAVLILRLIVDLPQRTSLEVIGGLTYSSNWIAMGQQASYSELFSAPSALAHLWSLAIEEQIYIAVPLMVWLVCRRRPAVLRRVLAATAIIAIALSVGSALLSGDHDTIYYGTHTRVGELAAGMLLALVVPFGHGRSSLRATVTGACGLVVHLALWRLVGVNDSWLYAGGLTACAGASVAMIDAVMRPGLIARLFNVPLLRWLGRISYGLYLFHWPATVVISPVRFDLGPVELFVTRVGVSLCLATISAQWLESPIRKVHDKRPARVVGGSVVALFAAASVGVAVMGATASPAAVSAPRARVLPAGTAEVPRLEGRDEERGVGAAGSVGAVGSASSYEKADPPIPAKEAPQPVRVALFGDSVPNWLVRDGAAALQPRSVELIDGTIEGCDGAVGMPIGRSGNGEELPVMDTCVPWDHWYHEVVDPSTDIAVLSIGQGAVVDRKIDAEWRSPCEVEFAEWYRADVVERLGSLQASTGEVVVVLPAWATDQSRWINPEDHRPRMNCVRETLQQAVELANASIRGLDSSQTADERHTLLQQPSGSVRVPVRVVDLAKYLCPNGENECRDVRSKDGVHIDEDQAEAVLGWLLDEVVGLSRSGV